MVSAPKRHFSAKDAVILGIFFLATIHCVRSIFLVNVSLIDLPGYAAGTERMPFQGRVAMMPILRWAERSAAMHRAADFFDKSLRNTPHFASPPEDVTPEKLACIGIGVLATMFAVGFILNYGWHRMGRLWWMPAALFLVMLYVSYAARYEAPYWYPYDLAHIAVFGVAAVCLLGGRYAPAFCLFLLDVPLRETSIFLVPVLLAVGYARRQRSVAGWALAMAAVWVPVRIVIARAFATNGSDVYVHVLNIERALINPLHWPQVASAFGFLLLPLCLGSRYLTRDERFFALGAVPGVLMTAVYGIWYESRIWDEWLLPAAVLLTLQAARAWSTERIMDPALPHAEEHLSAEVI